MQGGLRSVLIFANGELDDTDWIRPYVADAAAIIAADGGMRHLQSLGIRPNLIIGDLDSLPSDALPEPIDGMVNVLRYPEAKDETDLELALLYVSEHYPGMQVLVFGGVGGRLDQTLANLMLAAHPRLANTSVRFVEKRESAWLIREQTTITGGKGDRVSLLPIGGPAHVAATTGLRWPLRDEVLAFGPARGISNEMTAEIATVRLHSGLLLCIHATG